MAASQEKLYTYHVENMRSVGSALKQVSRQVKLAIKSEDPDSLRSFKPLYILLSGVWAECRLQKLLYEAGVQQNIRDAVGAESTQLDKWSALVRLAFRQHYSVPATKDLDSSTLGFTPNARMSEILDILNNELRLVMEVRNKLAHGQWVYPLNSDNTQVESDKYDLIHNTPYLGFSFRRKAVGHLCDIIHLLVVSRPTFERDFDKKHRLLSAARDRINNYDYAQWESELKARYIAGRAKMKANITSA
jgi:hypothetical protein